MYAAAAKTMQLACGMRPRAHRVHRAARRARHDRRHRAPRRGDRIAVGGAGPRRRRVHDVRTTRRAGSPSTAGCASATPDRAHQAPGGHGAQRAVDDRGDGPARARRHPPLPRDRAVGVHAAAARAHASWRGAHHPRARLRARQVGRRGPDGPEERGWISAHVPDATITVSKNLADFYLSRYARTAYYIPNGVAPPEPRPPRLSASASVSGGYYALFLGRLVPEKAPDLLLRAFRSVDTTARLVIAGGSSFTDGTCTSSRCSPLGIHGCFSWARCRASCSRSSTRTPRCSSCPRRSRACRSTLLEAASYRLPVVASDIPPNREVIGADGPGSRMFASGDEHGLADALARDDRRSRGGSSRGGAARRPGCSRVRLGRGHRCHRGGLRAIPQQGRKGAPGRLSTGAVAPRRVCCECPGVVECATKEDSISGRNEPGLEGTYEQGKAYG